MVMVPSGAAPTATETKGDDCLIFPIDDRGADVSFDPT
jgi:hypothetical protein